MDPPKAGQGPEDVCGRGEGKIGQNEGGGAIGDGFVAPGAHGVDHLKGGAKADAKEDGGRQDVQPFGQNIGGQRSFTTARWVRIRARTGRFFRMPP